MADEKVIALAGNPNVGKSTVFNALTGLNQHTGNWPGKTVTNAQGGYIYKDEKYTLVDLPGTYSLMAHSSDEEAARDFICFGGADAVVVVCDATCLERNLNLVLQIIEITQNVIVCVNLMDEATKKKISIDFERLKKLLGVPVIAANATRGTGLGELMYAIANVKHIINENEVISIKYTDHIEHAISVVERAVLPKLDGKLNARWISLKLLDEDTALNESLCGYIGYDITEEPDISAAIRQSKDYLQQNNISHSHFKDTIVSHIVQEAERICSGTVTFEKPDYNATDRKIDKLLTSKLTGIPVMLLLLAAIFWLTITGSNYPSLLISNGLFWLEDRLLQLFIYIGAPAWISDMLVLGVYRVLAWVVSVMLPPMAIFFPLFTLLEDLGYLPRVAFNLDNRFKKCRACGKQALTMCMR